MDRAVEIETALHCVVDLCARALLFQVSLGKDFYEIFPSVLAEFGLTGEDASASVKCRVNEIQIAEKKARSN